MSGTHVQYQLVRRRRNSVWFSYLKFISFHTPAHAACRQCTRSLTLCRPRSKCDCTRAETRLRLSAKRTSPFKSAEASVQSTTGSRGVRVSGSNAGYAAFRGSVKGTGYPLPFASFPFTSPPLCHCVTLHFNWTLSCMLWLAQGSMWDCIRDTVEFIESYTVHIVFFIYIWNKNSALRKKLSFVFKDPVRTAL